VDFRKLKGPLFFLYLLATGMILWIGGTLLAVWAVSPLGWPTAVRIGFAIVVSMILYNGWRFGILRPAIQAHYIYKRHE